METKHCKAGEGQQQVQIAGSEQANHMLVVAGSLTVRPCMMLPLFLRCLECLPVQYSQQGLLTSA